MGFPISPFPPDEGGIPPLPEPPLGGGIDIGALLGLIQSLIATFLGIIVRFINLIGTIVKVIQSIFRALGKFLLHIWQNYVKKAITWLASHVQKLRAWLRRTIGPIIARLEKIKKWYDTHILKQQLRMLQTLQTVRRFLGILRLFHVKWAAKLDGALADLQNRIEITISIVRGTLNQIINTLALVLDPELLITRNVLGATLLKNLGAVKRIFGFGDNRILSASEQATIEHDSTVYQKSKVDAHIKELAKKGPNANDKSLRAVFRKALADVTNTTLPTRAT